MSGFLLQVTLRFVGSTHKDMQTVEGRENLKGDDDEKVKLRRDMFVAMQNKKAESRITVGLVILVVFILFAYLSSMVAGAFTAAGSQASKR